VITKSYTNNHVVSIFIRTTGTTSTGIYATIESQHQSVIRVSEQICGLLQ